jgi:hypothetical protein
MCDVPGFFSHEVHAATVVEIHAEADVRRRSCLLRLR